MFTSSTVLGKFIKQLWANLIFEDDVHVVSSFRDVYQATLLFENDVHIVGSFGEVYQATVGRPII